MGNHEVFGNRKAHMVFPELVPQRELERRPFADFFTWRSNRKERSQEGGVAYPQPAIDPDLATLTTTLSVQNMHEFGNLFVTYLKARREVFITQKGWELPETDGMEFDQYDTPMARWIVIHRHGEVLAGVRIAPTTARCGNHSYMLRDAQLGLIPQLPSDALYEEAPVSKYIWEATRLFVSDAVPAKGRPAVQTALMKGMASAARSVGATQVIGIVPAVFKRWLKRIGMKANAVGPIMKIDGDRVQAALMDVVEYAS